MRNEYILSKCEERERLLEEHQELLRLCNINNDKIDELNKELESLCGNDFMFYDSDKKDIVLPEKEVKRRARLTIAVDQIINKAILPYQFSHRPESIEEKIYRSL